MADEDHRAALIKLGARRAEDFRWLRTAEQTLDVYNSALRQDSRKSKRLSDSKDRA